MRVGESRSLGWSGWCLNAGLRYDEQGIDTFQVSLVIFNKQLAMIYLRSMNLTHVQSEEDQQGLWSYR